MTGDLDTESPNLDQALDKAIDEAFAAGPEADTTLETIDAKDTAPGQPRDERGRWASKEPTEPVTEAVSPEGEVSAETSEAQPPQPEQQKAPDASATPGDQFRGWSKDEQAKFQALPAEARELVMARQTAERAYAQARIGEYERFREQVSPLANLAVENQDYYAAIGEKPVDAITNLVNFERGLRQGTWEQKLRAFDYLAQTYLGMRFPLPQPDDPFDPTQPGSEAYPQWHDHQQRLHQIEAENRRLKAESENRLTAEASSYVQQFAQQKNQDGSLAYPFFDVVRGQMGQLIEASRNTGRILSMEEAYKQAVAPIEQRFAAEAANRAKRDDEQRKAALEKAKRAAPVKTSGIAPGGNGKAASLDDAISSALSTWPS